MSFDDIRANHDILSVVEPHTRLSGRGPNRNGPCPFCGGRDRFYIDTRKQRWGCRTCTHGYHDVIDFVAKIENVSIADAARILEGLPPQRVERPEPKDAWRTDEWQKKAWTRMEAAKAMLYRPAPRAYLRARGLDFDWCIRYGIGYDGARWRPQTQEEAPAIVIPWRFADGKVTALKYRFIDEAAKADHGNRFGQLTGSEPTLFGTDLCTGAPTLLIVEGEFNCIALRQVLPLGQFDVVSFGSEVTTRYLPLITAKYPEVVLWQDTPEKAARTLDLIKHPAARLITSIDGRDANIRLLEGPDILRSIVLEAKP